MSPLVREIVGCLDRGKLDDVLSRYARELIDETLDEWDDAARWRTLVTRFGAEPIHEAAQIALRKAVDDLLREV